MFHHAAWAVGSCSNGPPAAGTVGTQSTGGFYRPDVSPCMYFMHTEIQMHVIMQTICFMQSIPGCQEQKEQFGWISTSSRWRAVAIQEGSSPERGRKYQKAFSGMRIRAECNRRVFGALFYAT